MFFCLLPGRLRSGRHKCISVDCGWEDTGHYSLGQYHIGGRRRLCVCVCVRVYVCVCVYCTQLNNTRNTHAKYALWALFAYGGSFFVQG